MFSAKSKFVILLLLVGLLSACARQATATSTSVSTTQAPASASDTPAAVAAANNAPTAQVATDVSFMDNIMPIFENSCIQCHGGQRIEKGLSLRTYADMMAGSQNGAVVVPGNAQESSLAELVANHKMPKRGPKLSDAQVQLIIAWINQGAQDN